MCCWPAIFASILFSENEKGQRLHGLRHAIVHAHCTCHEQRAMSKLKQAGWDLSSDFFDSLQKAEKVFSLRGFSQVNSTWKKWKSSRCCNRLDNKKSMYSSIPSTFESFFPTFRSSTCSSFNKRFATKFLHQAKQKKVSASTNMAQIFTGGRSVFFFRWNFFARKSGMPNSTF